MRRLRWLFALAGFVALLWLVSRLPDAVFGTTQTFLLVAAALILLLVAGAMFLLPARRLLASVFVLPLRREGPVFGMPPEDELRTVFRPLVAAGVCLAVAMLAGLLR